MFSQHTFISFYTYHFQINITHGQDWMKQIKQPTFVSEIWTETFIYFFKFVNLILPFNLLYFGLIFCNVYHLKTFA